MSIAIVLNGTSSSGKTTLARAFQERASRLFLNFSIDAFLYALPETAIARIVRGDDISDLRYPELVRGYYACAGSLLALRHDLILDHAITAEYHVEFLRQATAGHDVLLVGLDCPAEVLRERERARGDREVGLAEKQRRTIHSRLQYDLFIDTAATTPARAAEQIAEAIEQRMIAGERRFP